jgi:rSAM-partnered protein
MSTDQSGRTRTTDARADRGREWELFVREAETEPLHHVGSVTGPTEEIARQRAESLLGWSASAVWLCPADEVTRFDTRSLATDDGATATGAEPGGDTP